MLIFIRFCGGELCSLLAARSMSIDLIDVIVCLYCIDGKVHKNVSSNNKCELQQLISIYALYF